MKRGNQERYQLQARILKALAHPARLAMVDELACGERCVWELTDLVGSDISTISKHLSILRASGLIESEKRGTSVYYRLRCPCITQLLGCVEATMKEDVRKRLKVIKGRGR